MSVLRILGVIVFATASASANGRAPATNGVFFHPNDPASIYVRTTFGLVVSHDDGCTFRWICEQNIGYGGTFDPKYAVASDGTIFATTFEGLRVSRDGGCSFTTATAEKPIGDPGRIAEIWVDAFDLGPTGEVWAGTSESTRANGIYRSTDNGVTFEPRGVLPTTIIWKSLEVSRSNPQVVYATGMEFGGTQPDGGMGGPITHLYRTTNGGESWTPSDLSSITFATNPELYVAAIDPANANVFYVTSAGGPATQDRLYRSPDGGVTFTEVLMTPKPIADVVVRDASTVLVATQVGAHRSDDGGLTFQPISNPPQFGCLGQRGDGQLFGCSANWEPDFRAVGRSGDGATWDKIFRFVELAGPVECPVGTTQRDTCADQLWPGLVEQFGVSGPTCGAATDGPGTDSSPRPATGGGCCDTGTGGAGSMCFALVIGGQLLRRRRTSKA